MKDFSSLLKKVSDLKAKVEQNSITPLYLGALLDDFISAIESVDMTDMAADISAALSNAATALATAKQSLDAANAANTTADAAKSGAEAALATANAAKSVAEAAKQATDDLAADVVSAQSDISAQGDAIVAMQNAVDVVKSNLTTLQGTLSTHIQSASVREAALQDSLSINAIVAFDGSVGDVSDDTTYSGAPIVRDPNQRVSQGATKVYFSTADQQFLIYAPDEKHYYSDWDNAYLWQDADGLPYADKAYYNVNNGRLYQFIDYQLHEIALTRLQNDIGIVPCIVRNASPAEIMPGYPVGRNYTIWWSQTDKQFYAAIEYNYDVNGVMIENCNCYKISDVDDEDRDMYQVYDKRHMSYVPRTDRIYRDRTQLYRNDAVNEQMTALFDTSIINSESIVCSGTLDCNDFTAAAGEINGNLLVNSLEADGDVSAANVKTNTVSAATMQLGGVDANTLIVREFHGIRNSIPDGVVATTDKVSVKPVEGASYDIVYIRTLKRFVALAEGSYSDRFIGEEYYNAIANNKPTKAREDRVWRWKNDLYKLDPKGCIKAHYGYSNNKGAWINEYTPDLVCLTDNGLTEFVAKWREAICYSMMSGSSVGYYGDTDVYGNQIKHEDYGGYYPEWAAVEGKTPGFYINGIFGISYDEARLIYEYRTCGSYPRKILECGNTKLRTNLLCNYNYYSGGGQNGQGINTPMMFSSDGIKVVRVAAGVRGQRPPAFLNMMMYGTAWLRGVLSFNSNQYLEEVIGGVQVDAESILLMGNGFYCLKYLWIFNLNISLALTFKNASNLDIDCLRYLVEYSRATAAKPISVTLHPDLFARLTDDILELAETKYVTFVSA